MARISTVVASIVVLLSPAARSQPAPAFEVASIKPHEFPARTFGFGGPAGASIKISGNRITLLGTIAALVEAAYDKKGFQISGAPDWTDRAGKAQWYDIDAKIGRRRRP